MEYRNWNNKPLRTSLLGYGCMRFPTRADGSIDEPRAEALLNTAKAAGVNYFDTAYPYHNGQSEPFVGRVIAKWERSSFYLATKMPLWTCKNLADAQRIFEEQLQRLGVEYIDFYLLHSLHKARYEQAKELGIVDWLWEQKAAGRIRNFGFSCHDNAAGFEAILRDQPWDFCQLQYNYLDRDDRAEEISGDRGYQLTEECGVALGVLVAIILLMIMNRDNKPSTFLNDSERMLSTVGPLSMLPMLLACLGSVFTAAGVGDVISDLVSHIIPEGNVNAGIVVYAIGMMLFTMIMGNAYAAITVMTVGIGYPFVLAHGANPVVIGMLALTCGFCGTLCTPMAANFNTVPVALLDMKKPMGVIKNQVPVAIIMMVVQIVMMILLK